MDIQKKIEEFALYLEKKYAASMLMLLVAASERQMHWNIHQMYHCWVYSPPSLTTFNNLLKNLTEIGIIQQQEGIKKSEKILILNKEILFQILPSSSEGNMGQRIEPITDLLFDFNRVSHLSKPAA